jgi:hypothetical protein
MERELYFSRCETHGLVIEISNKFEVISLGVILLDMVFAL